MLRPYRGKGTERGSSINDPEAVFFNDRVGEHFLGNALELFLRFVTVPAIEIQHEEFSLAHIFHGSVTKPRECVLNRLSLRVEDGALWHNPHVCFHKGHYSKAAPAAGEPCGAAFPRVARDKAAPYSEKSATRGYVALWAGWKAYWKPISQIWSNSFSCKPICAAPAYSSQSVV